MADKPQTPDDIELVPDAWERFTRAVPVIARQRPEETPEPPKQPRRKSVQKERPAVAGDRPLPAARASACRA
jgi:hypothetical protein